MGKVVTSGKGQLLGAQGVPNVNHETDSLIFPVQDQSHVKLFNAV